MRPPELLILIKQTNGVQQAIERRMNHFEPFKRSPLTRFSEWLGNRMNGGIRQTVITFCENRGYDDGRCNIEQTPQQLNKLIPIHTLPPRFQMQAVRAYYNALAADEPINRDALILRSGSRYWNN